MPQGRRKVPFSGKKKKEQLVVKRQRKGTQNYLTKADSDSDESQDGASPSGLQVQKINSQRSKNTRQSRYALQFFKESNKDLVHMKQKAHEPLVYLEPKEREIGESYFENYDFPIRPPWDYNMSKQELDRNENRYFTQYTKAMEERHNSEEKVISLFELNLETWRQLWRVLEISDIVLIIVDIRYPTLMFPPSLFTYIKTVLNKDVILILNKIDLVRPEVVVAWKHYFLEKYPEISISLFASYRAGKASNMKVTKKRPNQRNNGESVLGLFKCVKNIVGTDLDLTKWEEKIREDIAQSDIDLEEDSGAQQIITKSETYEIEDHVKYKNGILTIGCVGFPNVGKSSIINTLKGRKVVSVSRTPGHTKYFQTIFLTDNVKLCDCPGLVFPSSTPKPLQVILGSYPIAQLREPYASIRFVGERINLPDILTIQLPEDYSEWSPVALCEAWALKKGFLTAKAARPDTYRAANNILQLVLQGRLVLDFFPPEFTLNEDKWRNHPDMQEVQKLQNRDLDTEEESIQECSSHSENEENKSESSDDEDSDGDTTTNIRKSANAFSLLDD